MCAFSADLGHTTQEDTMESHHFQRLALLDKNGGISIWKLLRQDPSGTPISWIDLYDFLSSREESLSFAVVDPETTCCYFGVHYHDDDEYYPYRLEITSSSEKKTLKISAVECAAAEATLTALLRSCTDGEVNIKAFATTPRQKLPELLSTSSETKLSCIRLHFLDIPNPTALLRLTTDEMELVQCTVTNLSTALQEESTTVQKLTLSCSMPEFVKLTTPFGTSVKTVHLLLHFWLQGTPFVTFCQDVLSTSLLTELSIHYLDIIDDAWIMMMQSLQPHRTLAVLTLGFTDAFEDNYRRLTSDRRRMRTQAVLDLVTVNPTIEHIAFPEFQQDATLMIQVNVKLEENRQRRQCL